MYSGHAETLAPLLAAFGKPKYTVTEPKPASALFLEFYQEHAQIYVRVYFRQDLKEEDIGTWTIDRFDQFVQEKTYGYDTKDKVNGCVVEACKQDYTAEGRYWGQRAFKNELFKSYDLPTCTYI